MTRQRCCVKSEEDESYCKYTIRSEELNLRKLLEENKPKLSFADCNQCTNKVACLIGGSSKAFAFTQAPPRKPTTP